MISSSLLLREYANNDAVKQLKQSFRRTKFRFLALFLACMIMLGDAYCFDNPMAMQSQIQKQFAINNFQFNLLYTVYSLPNIVLPFFGGLLIDKIGARTAILIFSTIILIGQLICVFGVYITNYWTLIAGRIVFGMGSESLNTSQNSIMAQWFKNKEISMAIGLCISLPRVGSAMNSFISPIVAEKTENGIANSFLVGTGFLIFSYGCGLILIYMDKESDRREKKQSDLLTAFLKDEQKNNKVEDKIESQTQLKQFTDDEKMKDIDEIKGHPLSQEDSDEEQEEKEEKEVEGNEVEEIKLSDIAKMPGTFWIVIIICMLTEALFIPFLDNGNDFFQVRFGFTPSQAGTFLTIPYLISATLTPFLGVIVDKVIWMEIGNRGLLIIFTSFVFLTTHILLLFLSCDKMCFIVSLPLFGLGFCFALYSSVIIPSVPAVVQPKLIGTAFGLMGVFQNTALALFPMITGVLFNHFSKEGPNEELNETRGYYYQSLFFVGMSIFLLFISIALLFVDKAGGKQLSKSNIKRKLVEQKDSRNPQLASKNRPQS